MKVLVCCHKCQGTGKFVSDELTRTAMAVPTRRSVSATEVFAALAEPGIQATAINNRLRKLSDLGVIALVGKRGKSKLFQRIRVR